MSIYKIKRFSFWGKTKAGLKGFGKGAKYGAIAGAVLAPGNVTLALLGKEKAAAIVTAAGAGVGAGIGGYLGAKDSINSYNYEERLKNDPKFREKELKKKKDEVNDFINEKLKNQEATIDSNKTIKDLRKVEKENSILFKSDLYDYIKFYEKFSKKNYSRWYKAAENLLDLHNFDNDFSYIFPNPDFSIQYDNFKVEEFLQSVEDEIPVFMVAGNVSNSDHSFLYYHFDDNSYSFDLGSGFDSNSISKTISNFTKRWKIDLNKVDRNVEGLYKMTSVHNQIIDEFISGLKMIK